MPVGNYTHTIIVATGGTPISGSPFSLGAGVTSFTIPGLTAATTYSYTVTTTGSCTTQGGTNSTMTECPTPGTPTAVGFTGTSTSTSATLTTVGFTGVSPTPTAYVVVRSTAPLTGTPTSGVVPTVGTPALAGTSGIGDIVVASGGTATSYPQTGLVANQLYFYTVFAYNNTNCTSGPQFSVVSALNSNSLITCPPPSTITNGPVVPTTTTIPITINDNAGGGAVPVGSYTHSIIVATGGTAIPTSPYAVGAGITSFTITGLNAATTYSYTVTTTGSCTTVGGSNTINTECPTPGIPTAVGFTSTSTSTSATVTTVSFTGVSPTPTAYVVVQSIAPLTGTPTNGIIPTVGTALAGTSGAGDIVVQTGSTFISYPETNLVANQLYFYTVFAYNNTNCTSGPQFSAVSTLNSNSLITCPSASTILNRCKYETVLFL